jgi:putative transposase
LPERGWVRNRSSRQLLDTFKNVANCCLNGKGFTWIQIEREAEQWTRPSTSAVGIDMGVFRFATLSDETAISLSIVSNGTGGLANRSCD